jgi:uncharacterized delta-60 repeat protein
MNQKATSYLCLLALSLVLTAKSMSAQTPGTLDPTFGSGGKVTTDFGGTGAAARTVAVQTDGKIIVAGLAVINGAVDFALSRYTSDGTLDTSFGTGGTVTTAFDFPGNFDRVFTVVRQPDGKFVAVGSTVMNPFANFALVRFNPDGTLDASFGTGGIVTTDFGVSAEATSAVVQADGKIVAAGYANLNGGQSFALARYNSNGTLDTTFGTGGKMGTAFDSGGFSYAQAFSVAVQPDGRIVAAGYAEIGACLFNGLELPCFDLALARYDSNGSLDASFGTGGRVTTDFASPNDQAKSVAVQLDGKIVVAGEASPFINRGFDFALARYNSNGTLDTTFGTSGKVTTDFAGSNDVPSEPYGVALQGDGKIVVIGQTLVGDVYDFALARYNTNGTLDTSFGTSGKLTTDYAGGYDVPFSVAVQPDGNILLAGGATINSRSEFALARYLGGTVFSTPDIDTAPASLAFGNVIQGSFKDLAVTVRNTGTATLNVTSTTLLGTAEYSIVTGGGAFSLAPAATRQVTVRLTPTSLGSKVATLSFASNDTDENPKNVPLSGTGVTTSSDLVVSALTGPATAGAGFAITLNETTGNIGVAPAGGTSTRYYLSSDTAIGAGDVLLGGRSLAGLAPSGSSAGATNVTIPAGTVNGSYFIVARADDLNQALETNEGNNTRALAIRIGPDLRVSSLTASTYATAGGTISISDTTANLSASSPAGASTTRFYLSTNTTLDAADIPLGFRAVPALASGASSAGATLVTIPAGTATGTYNILAEADDAHVLAEKNEANNLSSRILRVGPDLVTAVRSIAGTPRAGTTISVQDLTSDPSTVAAPQSTTGYYLSTDNRLDAADVRIGGRAIPALAAGGSSLASGQAVIPAGTVPGAYFILAVADYPKVIVESNEGNNANAFPITVVP